MATIRVVLYGHDGCPGTAGAREYLCARGIAFEERDIADPGARAEMRRWHAWATPLLVLDGRFAMVGFDGQHLEALIERAGGGEPDVS